jgi:hypothetical protein
MSRARELTALLDNQEPVDLARFCSLCKAGISETSAALRPRSWRLLIGIVDHNRKDAWQEELERARSRYYSLVEDLSSECDIDEGVSAFYRPYEVLTLCQTSKSETLRSLDQALLSSAHDVQRTAASLAFFAKPVRSPNPLAQVAGSRELFKRLWTLSTYKTSRRRVNRYSTGSTSSKGSAATDTSEELYWESLQRVLFVYSALSPLGYVQGMAEVSSVGSTNYVLTVGRLRRFCCSCMRMIRQTTDYMQRRTPSMPSLFYSEMV